MSVDPAGLIQPLNNFGDAFEKIKQDIKDMRLRTSRYRRTPPPNDIPLNIQRRPLHPDNPADADSAIMLLSAFEQGGVAGLAGAIQHQAHLHQNDNRVNPKKNYLVFNEANLLHFMMLLASMYPGFIVGLISGDIYRRYAEDTQLRSAVNLLHALIKSPGNYLQAVVHPETIAIGASGDGNLSTQAHTRIQNKDMYKGLTFAQLYEVWKITKRYLPSSPEKDMTVVEWIDKAFPPVAKDVDYSVGRHKYVHKQVKGSHGNEKKFEQWLEEIEKQYIGRIKQIIRKDPNDPILQVPMRVSLLEIGWGKDVLQRSSSHDDHRSSNSLFTYFQAALKCIDPTTANFQIVRFATNLLNRGDNIDDAFLDGTLGDVGITMLGHSEWFNAGLNPQPGGGAGIQKKPLEDTLERIQEQGDKTFATMNSRFQLNVAQSYDKVKVMKTIYQITDKEFQQREKAVEDGRKARQDRWAKIEIAVKMLENMNTLRLARKVVQADQQPPTSFWSTD